MCILKGLLHIARGTKRIVWPLHIVLSLTSPFLLFFRTDILIMIIPFKWFPMLRVTFWHKVAIGLLLCSGFFVIAAAIVRSVLTLYNIDNITNKVIWAIREMVNKYSSLYE